jgi:hypothetical protein
MAVVGEQHFPTMAVVSEQHFPTMAVIGEQHFPTMAVIGEQHFPTMAVVGERLPESPVEYSKAEATFDKSSSSENSGSESEEVVELKRAKEVRNLERIDVATETVPGGIGAREEQAELETRVPIRGGKVPDGHLGQIAGDHGDHLIVKLEPVGAT